MSRRVEEDAALGDRGIFDDGLKRLNAANADLSDAEVDSAWPGT